MHVCLFTISCMVCINHFQFTNNYSPSTGMSSHNVGIHYELHKGNQVGRCGLATPQLTFKNLAKNWALKLAKGANFTIKVIT